MNSMEKNSKIYVAGHNGLVGSTLIKALKANGYKNIIRGERNELDLRNSQQVNDFFEHNKPEYVFLCAAKVGGIKANNDNSGEFIYDNLNIQTNVLESARVHKVKKLLFLGSSCIYPKFCPQPIKEEYLLTGKLEETNSAYAVAKIAGIEMCKAYNKQYKTNFISVMPTNLYGPGDNFNLETSHVLPAIIHKMHNAKIGDIKMLQLWGSGMAHREFLYIEDLADALIFLMNKYNDSEPINVGSGTDLSIQELVSIIKKIIGYDGPIIWDGSKPDGTPKKLLDVTRIHNLGWTHKTNLELGIQTTYDWFLKNYENIRK